MTTQSSETAPLPNGVHVLVVSFHVPGNPVAKQRPRIFRDIVYTPKKTLDYEALVAQYAMIAMAGRDMLTGELSVSIISRRETKHRADIDNIEKSVMDGMEGVVYKNDSQVVETYNRLYRGVKPGGVDIIVKKMESE